MKIRKKTSSEVIRSKSWKSQPDFDNLIRDIDISSLRFLKSKYKKDITYYKRHTDLSDEVNLREFKGMQQRLKMISEELERRYHDTILIGDKDIHFSNNHDYVISESKDGLREVWQVSLDDIGIKTKKIGNVREKKE